MSSLLAFIPLLILIQISQTKIYVYYTRTGPSTEYYDCLYLQSYIYCRRPDEPVDLNRDDYPSTCHHNGILHRFHHMKSKNISTSTVLYEWKSTIEMAERYARYLQQQTPTNEENNRSICQCEHLSAFGKSCEYLLPHVGLFSDAATLQPQIRRSKPWSVQMHGQILCYKTLQCNSGLLCLDWRDICDGRQQCMYGYDEENCDLLEFNECEDDEYRCMNGMCIPSLYFLDGDYDCADLSDEKGAFSDGNCTFQQATLACDERICVPNQWSCGDGQCIGDRTSFQDRNTVSSSCGNKRNEAYMCETHSKDRLWTLPSGLCIIKSQSYNASSELNNSRLNPCYYCLKCKLSQNAEVNCETKKNWCHMIIETECSDDPIQYPPGAIIAPYLFYYYTNWKQEDFPLSDRMVINGTIKCRGYLVDYYEEREFFAEYLLIDLEYLLCTSNESSAVHMEGGFDPYCYNSSTTFNHRPYFFYDVCTESKECVSAYRVGDGYRNCRTVSDENQTELTSTTCKHLHRYRFSCSNEKPTCLTANSLGDTYLDCPNDYDESWMGFGSALSKLNCNSKSKEDCAPLRVYIEESWQINTDSSFQVNTTRPIAFRAYCDTFWDYSSKKDEDATLCQQYWECLENQWRCHTGQCIETGWILDGEWDCSDASDEEAILFRKTHLLERNARLVHPPNITKSFRNMYANRSLTSICPVDMEFPCYRINASNPLKNDRSSRPCISLDKLGDKHVDCEGGIDERNTIEYCKRTMMLGGNFKCLTSQTCHSYSLICDQRCAHQNDDQNVCYSQHRDPQCNDTALDFVCHNGTCIKGGLCNNEVDCLNGEDEYMCSDPDENKVSLSSYSYYRRDKEYGILYEKQSFRLPLFPSTLNGSKMDESKSSPPTYFFGNYSALEASPLPYVCNRGVGVTLFDGSIVCFCPQTYYGDRCQHFNDRLTLIFQMNYSQSIYANSEDLHLVLKMIVLLLDQNKTVDSYEFHNRPSFSGGQSSKKIDHFVYSRTKERLAQRSRRYFNRSEIINEHPYSIRIEAYQIGVSVTPKLIALWYYTVHFDFLPSYRFAKILYLNPSFTGKDPCSSNPCAPKKTCHRLHNDPSHYLCLCPNGSPLDDCSEPNALCAQNYCSAQSLCKTNYRGLLKENHLPYCICPSGRFGSRCHLEHDQCRSNPCQHNGTCFPTSTPGRYICLCPNLYEGEQCERKKAAVQLFIQNKDEHRGAVVQYFDVNLVDLNLVLLNQRAYHSLPDSLSYLNAAESFAELLLVRLYSDTFLGLYLLALHINMPSIHGITFVNRSNLCLPVEQLFDEGQDVNPIKYHHLCKNNHSLLCFYDDSYLCICEKDHRRADCFTYDNSLHRCSKCLAGGQCLRGDRSRPDDYICLCPLCYSGRFCQFSSKTFSFTFDQLFSIDLLSSNPKVRHLTFYSIIVGSWFIWLLGLGSNLCSFVTFRRRQCRSNGVGHYLFAICVVNQISLTCFACRLTHLAVNITSYRCYPWLDTFFCATFNYIGVCSIRIAYCLVSIISVERAYTTMFINKHWLKKPGTARIMIVCVCIILLVIGAYEPFFVKSHAEFNDGKSSICVLEFPLHQPVWFNLHQTVTIVNAVLPLLINLFCIIIIICVVVKKKMRVTQSDSISGSITQRTGEINRLGQRRRQTRTRSYAVQRAQRPCFVADQVSRLRLLREVIRENKESVIAPTFILVPQLFSLPPFFASLILACQTIETSRIRFLFIASCGAAFTPQVFTFFLYVKPSSFYSKQWQSTRLCRKLTEVLTLHRSQTAKDSKTIRFHTDG